MIIGNRFGRIIFITFGILLIFLNLYYFLWGQEIYAVNGEPVYNFHGFGWFFGKMGQFPGLQRTIDFVNDIPNYINLTDNGENFSMDSFMDILRIIALPFMIIGTMIVNIFENIIWLFSFIFDFFPKN